MTQTELAAELVRMAAQSEKIAAEQGKRFDDVTAALKALQDLIEAGAITAELQAASVTLQSKLDALDATIPDEPA